MVYPSTDGHPSKY